MSTHGNMDRTEHALAAEPPITPAENAARLLLGAVLVFAGTSHLTFARKAFQAQVPPWLPMDPDTVVLLSGAVEISMGTALLLLKKQRVPVGLAAATLFAAVFPGNVAQYTHHRNAFGLDTDAKRLLRLFGQPPLIAWALWSTGAWKALRGSR